MPHALLLSPDDQAVSAITGVLEEMSVSCERPLDGVSAAQKLNSRSFDLVLVDCENLPAAKLIFDVCRRGKHGTNPVPIAIVDGRAGLPTAFRLGAELILTKPVAKDQARNTIRTAVSRLRKEEPARVAWAPEAASMAAAISMQPEERAQAAAAVASSQPLKISHTTATDAAQLAPAPTMSTTVQEVAPSPATPLLAPATSTKSTAAPDLFVASKPRLAEQLSDDPVLADLEQGDVRLPSPPVLSSYEPAPQSRGPLVAVLMLALAGGGVYAAWMHQPGFRALVQPQIDRALALAGIASQQQAVPAPQVPAQTPAQTLAAEPSAASPTDAAPTDGSSTPAISADAVPAAPTTTLTATTPAAPSAPAVAKREAPADSKKIEMAATASDSEFPDDNGAVILSSKGAEKRLVYHVSPALPQSATARERESTVILKTVVDGTGKVEKVHLVEGSPALADAAIQAVKQWRYRPYVRDGKSMAFQTVVLVDFQRP